MNKKVKVFALFIPYLIVNIIIYGVSGAIEFVKDTKKYLEKGY